MRGSGGAGGDAVVPAGPGAVLPTAVPELHGLLPCGRVPGLVLAGEGAFGHLLAVTGQAEALLDDAALVSGQALGRDTVALHERVDVVGAERTRGRRPVELVGRFHEVAQDPSAELLGERGVGAGRVGRRDLGPDGHGHVAVLLSRIPADGGPGDQGEAAGVLLADLRGCAHGETLSCRGAMYRGGSASVWWHIISKMYKKVNIFLALGTCKC